MVAALRAVDWPEGDIENALRVFWCESNYKVGARGAAGEYGIAQIHPNHGRSVWGDPSTEGLGTIYRLGFTPHDLITDPVANLTVARYLRKGGWSPWTCASLVGVW